MGIALFILFLTVMALFFIKHYMKYLTRAGSRRTIHFKEKPYE